jgi:hypothetical protein
VLLSIAAILLVDCFDAAEADVEGFLFSKEVIFLGDPFDIG